MTPTKRKRLHVERGNRLPGDLCLFAGGGVLRRALPLTARANTISSAYILKLTDLGLIITFDEFLEQAYVLVKTGENKDRCGWVSINHIRSLDDERNRQWEW